MQLKSSHIFTNILHVTIVLEEDTILLFRKYNKITIYFKICEIML